MTATADRLRLTGSYSGAIATYHEALAIRASAAARRGLEDAQHRLAAALATF